MSSAVVYISIGNSDDKLNQADWSEFVRRVHYAVTIAADSRGGMIHGAWHSQSSEPYQNACWALQLPDDPRLTTNLRSVLIRLAREYRQDSIAWALVEHTTFLAPEMV